MLIKPSTSVAAKKIHGLWHVLLNGSDEYIVLNETASIVWDAIIEGLSVEQMCRKLQHKYDVPAKTAKSDVEEILKQLSSEHIIQID